MRSRPALLAAVVAAACSRQVIVGSPSPAPAATQLRDASGRVVGTAAFVPTAEGTRVTVAALHLPPGTHGMHLHAVGACTPDFAAAGAHFNPTARQHGRDNPNGPHAGDLPNLTVGADSTGVATTVTPAVTLDSGPTSLFDADGSALVIHAKPDDYVTDPSGNSGARIACGVVTR